MNERLLNIITEENLSKISEIKIVIIGIGGVGGYVLEALIRSGFINITLIDFDQIEESNLNRQIISTENNIGEKKCIEAKKRACSINRNAKITTMNLKIDQNNISLLDPFDYVIDACDDVAAKTSIIRRCVLKKIKIITCMGTGNRMNPEDLTITKLKKSYNCPLAKKIRYELREDKSNLEVMALWSKEEPIKNKFIGTICSLPMSSGAYIVSYIIKDIIKE